MTWTGIPTPWDRHWVVVTWWTAAIATGWLGIAVLMADLPDLTPPGGSGFTTLFELAPAGLAALGATLYVAIAATAVLAVLVPVSAGPGRQEPRRGLAKLNQSQGEMRRWWGSYDGAGAFSKYGPQGFTGATQLMIIAT